MKEKKVFFNMRKTNTKTLLTLVLVASCMIGCSSIKPAYADPTLASSTEQVEVIEEIAEEEAVEEEIAEPEIEEEIIVTGVELNYDNMKREYSPGEELDLSSLTVHTLFSDGHKEDLTEGYEVSEVDMDSYGEKEITISYGEFSDSLTVEVVFHVEDTEPKTMYSTSALNVRKGPSTSFEQVGSYKVNDEIKVTGKCDNGWSRVEYNGSDCYVSTKYLSDKKIEIVAATPVNADTTALVFEGDVSQACRNKALELYSHVPSNVKQAIANSGYSVIVTTSPNLTEGHCGTYWPTALGQRAIAIYAKSVNAVNIAVIHEIGHFIDEYVGIRDGHGACTFGYRAASSSGEFQEIYVSERGASGFPGYATDCYEDYFAEVYWKACVSPGWCQRTIPRSYEYVMRMANSI